MRKYIGGLIVFLALCHAPSLADGFGIRQDGKLDKAVLSKAYKESDWDELSKTLEGYLRGKDVSKIDVEERIFAYKHLGVIYAANWDTQTRAESFFNQLLELSPEIEIVDMYVSKKISDFFRDVKQDFKNQKAYSSNYDEFGRRLPNAADRGAETVDSPNERRMPPPAAKPKEAKVVKSEAYSWIWWTVGLASAAGIGAAAYYLSQDVQPERKPEVTTITP